MKRVYKILCLLLVITFLLPYSVQASYGMSKKNITILFTHDMHDHLLPANIKQDGITKQLGGEARLFTAIQEEKKKDNNLLLLDAGDFSMGTLFQSIYSSDAPELRMLGHLGYDVTTFGNHEFDFRADGLSKSLESALKSKDKLPQIVQSNISFKADKNGRLSNSLMNLKQAMKDYGVKDYTIIKRNGIKIGIFGIMGKEADSDAPLAEVKFTDQIENAKRVVKTLKEQEKVDLIICLSHSGTDKNKKKSEDEILAKEVPQIDVIISGHSHTKLDKPIVIGKTIIGSCGEYSENLGIIKVTRTVDNQWSLADYRLRQINDTLSSNNDITKTINDFKLIVQNKYLNRFDLKFDDVLANSPFDFTETSKIGAKHEEDTLGNFIGDAYRYAVKEAEGSKYDPVTAAIIASGTIRGSFVKGNITVADAFTASSLGLGADKISGYPLISVYLTGKEIKTACEVDASISPIMSSAQLYISGISFTFNPNRLIFNKVTDAHIQKNDGTIEKLNDKKLYRVVAGLYSGQMLSIVGEKSFGLLSLVPKTKAGVPIKDFEKQIIKTKLNGKDIEVKEWLAIAEYLKSFKKVNGISQIPQYYSIKHDRKIVNDNHNIIALVGKPNGIALALYGIVLVILAIIIFIIIKIRHNRNRKKNRYIFARRKKTRFISKGL